MLSENDMVNARNILESCFTDKCNIDEIVKIKNQHSVFEERIIPLCQNTPCKISFKQSRYIINEKNFIRKNEAATLFLPYNTEITENCIFSVKHCGEVMKFSVCGNIRRYQTHTEVSLNRIYPQFT